MCASIGCLVLRHTWYVHTWCTLVTLLWGRAGRNDGQIHLFLSKALTFFERSGLNVTGGLNLDNVTAFEVRKFIPFTLLFFGLGVFAVLR